MEQTRIGDLLLEADLVTEKQLEAALKKQARTGWKLGSTLVSLGLVDENVLATFLSMQTGVPCVSLRNVYPSPAVLELLPGELARRAQAIPVKKVDETLHVAMTDPTDARVLEELRSSTGLRIVPLIAPSTTISQALEDYYPRRGRPRGRPSLPPHHQIPVDIEAELEVLERAVEEMAQSIRRLKRRLRESG